MTIMSCESLSSNYQNDVNSNYQIDVNENKRENDTMKCYKKSDKIHCKDRYGKTVY